MSVLKKTLMVTFQKNIIKYKNFIHHGSITPRVGLGPNVHSGALIPNLPENLNIFEELNY